MADGKRGMADEPDDEAFAEVQFNEHVKAFFLNLAAKGKVAWNRWRHDPANEDVQVTFAGVDFSEKPRDQIDFSGFEFGDGADFFECIWLSAEWEEIRENTEVFVPGRALFVGATFGDGAQFTGAKFGDGANFTGVTFDAGASFVVAAFGDHAHFANAVFGNEARFDFATFGDFTNFESTTFGITAFFGGITFGNGIFFDRA